MKWKVIDLEKGEMKFIEQSYKLNFYQQKTNNFISYSQKKTISFHNKLKKVSVSYLVKHLEHYLLVDNNA
jgi:hypothetical protein